MCGDDNDNKDSCFVVIAISQSPFPPTNSQGKIVLVSDQLIRHKKTEMRFWIFIMLTDVMVAKNKVKVSF